MKGLEIEEELETTNLDKSWKESDALDSEEVVDSDEMDQLKAKQTRRQRKLTPIRRDRWVKEHRCHNSEGAEKGLVSRQANREGRGVRNRTGRGK